MHWLRRLPSRYGLQQAGRTNHVGSPLTPYSDNNDAISLEAFAQSTSSSLSYIPGHMRALALLMYMHGF